jgi:hypothetical protein
VPAPLSSQGQALVKARSATSAVVLLTDRPKAATLHRGPWMISTALPRGTPLDDVEIHEFAELEQHHGSICGRAGHVSDELGFRGPRAATCLDALAVRLVKARSATSPAMVRAGTRHPVVGSVAGTRTPVIRSLLQERLDRDHHRADRRCPPVLKTSLMALGRYPDLTGSYTSKDPMQSRRNSGSLTIGLHSFRIR